jgi:acetyl esterase/lipase
MPTNGKQSPYLILHAHGGGFIAQSSQSHEIYLKPWCKELKIPIVSIDYSLAPEYPYPRASQECFYVYAWCLLNKNLLGWTGEKIICVGDSAGGLLVTNIVQQAIVNKVRIPDALVPIYTPFMTNYNYSPSRLLSLMDPLLNIGMLYRCISAYYGIDIDKEKDRFKAEVLNDEKTKENDYRFKRLHQLLGDSVYLIEKCRKHPFSKDPFMSPLLSDDSMLAKFPHTFLIVSFAIFLFKLLNNN